MIFIGIDPGADARGNIGICIASERKNINVLDTVDFFEFQAMTSAEHPFISTFDKVIAIVEDSRINGGAYDRKLTGKKRDGQLKRLGMNQLISRMIIDWMKKQGHEVLTISPQQKGSKWNADFFRLISGYKGKLKAKHQHAIDAYQVMLPTMQSYPKNTSQ